MRRFTVLALLFISCGGPSEQQNLLAGAKASGPGAKAQPDPAIQLGSSLSLASRSNIASWIDVIADTSSAECRPSVEIANLLVCAFPDSNALAAATVRIIAYDEVGLLRWNDPRLNDYDQAVLGFLLVEELMTEIDAVASRQCATNQLSCLAGSERSFFDLARSFGTGRDRWSVVAFVAGNQNPWGANVYQPTPINLASHELYHGRYHLDDDFHSAVDDYYNGLSDDLLAEVNDALSSIWTPDELMVDEFQAYTLGSSPEHIAMGTIISKHQQPLKAALAAAHVSNILQ